ncbi:hypothetical protein UK23_07560 [Lentzea aerocolonigenes]|uniref:Uncharacterized protein n=1 Tax=Lentzea aerocolonigenes TaxID=68170 RepID=A0A0F0H8Y9_LENAE|nr:hypothetical protein [Lentzea aerocolonigenes]KJK51336.1 hypothetical protein UK23_07560 [Lentzea aerocolonigenes]
MTGYGVDLGAMGHAIKGVNDTVAALKDFAPDGGHLMASSTALGWLCPSEDECGDEVLADALEEFFERWKWGVRHLVKEGAEMVTALTDTKSVYEKAEDKVKEGFQLLLGDPTSQADPTKQSWEELGKPYLKPTGLGEEWDKASKGFEKSLDSAEKDITGEKSSFKPAGDRR